MVWVNSVVVLTVLGIVVANPVGNQVYTEDDRVVKTLVNARIDCDNGNDSLACLKFQTMKFIYRALKTDNFKLTDNIEIRKNSESPVSGRSETGILDTIQYYTQTHDIILNAPFFGTKLTFSQRNINNDEFDVKFKFNHSSEQGAAEVILARKSKMRKVILPIMVLILLKTLTIIPLAIGVLGLKAFNSLQLGFISFLISAGLAVFQLCKKLALDHHPPHIIAQGPWEGKSYSNSQSESQQMAYSAYE